MTPGPTTPAELAALHAQCFTHPRPWSADEFAALLAQSGTYLCPLPHGFALGRAIAGEAELLSIAVAPEVRRRGTGRQLMAAFEQAARAQGATEAFLEVAADNIAAQALYQRCGYSESGRRKGYYKGENGDRIDALLLRKPL